MQHLTEICVFIELKSIQIIISLRFQTAFLLLLTLASYTYAQEKKSVEALFITSPLNIDAHLDEKVYNEIAPAGDFVQLQPYNGQPSFQPSEAYFFYDQNAVYVGAILYDSDPDSIFNLFSERDQIGMSDYFGVYFDPYNEGQLAFGFFITPAGVQTDIKAAKSDQDYEDGSWDAVWESATRVADEGWIVEMRIPYSALRFPEKDASTWGLNMFRNIRRYNSNNSWNFIDRNISGFIHQEGELTGIRNLKPPVRLSVSPYVSTYLESRGGSKEFLYRGGMDLKYGINESFTLDMKLVPDFGQIQSDDQELNLSPYELHFDERRQFFTEGVELFNRGDIFYSRRIGSSPMFTEDANNDLADHEIVDYNPTETRLVNATKISGRTDKGLGIGFLNAITLPANAIIKDTLSGNSREVTTQPLTNYNVTVFDKSLRNNSYVSLINTNVVMANNPFYANVTATEFELRDRSKTYVVRGTGGISTRNEDGKETGYGIGLELAKNSGKVRYGISQNVLSDKVNTNDLGYMRRNNEVTSGAYLSYHQVEPSGIFREWHTNLNLSYIRLYNPNDFYTSDISLVWQARLQNNYFLVSLLEVASLTRDYYEARVPGHYYISPAGYTGFIEVNSDSRKKLNYHISLEGYNQPSTDRYYYSASGGTTLRAGQRFQFSYRTKYRDEQNNRGFVGSTDSNDTIYFAKRNIRTAENTFSFTIGINNKAGISFRMRHYWSGALNKTFYRLQQDGGLEADPNYADGNDNNYNAFNIDMIFRWIFAPGSELTLAWKNAIYCSGDIVNPRYFENLGNTWESEQTNSISLKVLYYLDYNYLRKNK